MVQPQTELIRVLSQGLRRQIEICPAIGPRKQAQKSLRKWVDKRQLVVRNWLLGKYVEELVGLVIAYAVVVKLLWRRAAQLPKIPRPLCQRRHGRALRFALAVAKTLVKSEEESLVPANWPTKSPAELILLQRLNGRSWKTCGIERVIA